MVEFVKTREGARRFYIRRGVSEVGYVDWNVAPPILVLTTPPRLLKMSELQQIMERYDSEVIGSHETP